MEIVHNHDNDYLDWLFHQNVFPLRESTSIMSGNSKGFTLEESSIEHGGTKTFSFSMATLTLQNAYLLLR